VSGHGCRKGEGKDTTIEEMGTMPQETNLLQTKEFSLVLSKRGRKGSQKVEVEILKVKRKVFENGHASGAKGRIDKHLRSSSCDTERWKAKSVA